MGMPKCEFGRKDEVKHCSCGDGENYGCVANGVRKEDKVQESILVYFMQVKGINLMLSQPCGGSYQSLASWRLIRHIGVSGWSRESKEIRKGRRGPEMSDGVKEIQYTHELIYEESCLEYTWWVKGEGSKIPISRYEGLLLEY